MLELYSTLSLQVHKIVRAPYVHYFMSFASAVNSSHFPPAYQESFNFDTKSTQERFMCRNKGKRFQMK